MQEIVRIENAFFAFCLTIFLFLLAKQHQGEERQADFINIVAWSKTAEFISKYFARGRRIALTGRIQTESYTDRDGNKRYTTDVVAENVEFCESKLTSNNVTSPQNTPSDAQDKGVKYDDVSEEDLPF